MHHAADFNTDLVSVLLKYGARVDIKDNFGANPLARPVHKGDSELVEKMMAGQKTRDALFDALETNSLNGRIMDINKMSVLVWAIALGHVVVTWMILHYGSFTTSTPIEVPGIPAFPSLVIATEWGQPGIVKLLIRLGVDSRTCARALHSAAGNGKTEIAEILLDYGCHVNGFNDGGRTPLRDALTNRHDEMVRLLCKHGADLAAEEEALNLSVVIGPKQVFYGIRHQR